MWVEIAHEVDQMHASVWCLDVWEGATQVHTLMSSSHTALLLYFPSLLPLLAYCACPFSRHLFLFLRIHFLHAGHQQVGHFTVVFIEIK